jgi:hypothetical protein
MPYPLINTYDTAFSYRNADFSIALSPTMTTREGCEAQKGWVRAFRRALEPHSVDGGDQHRVGASYRDNHARPKALKQRYDPGNLFRLNHDIAP